MGVAATKTPNYIEHHDGMYRIAGSRVSLDSIVYAYLRGQTPESIAQSFPTLSLEQVFGALAFYLAHQAVVDTYLEAQSAEYEALRRDAINRNPGLYAKLAAAKRAS